MKNNTSHIIAYLIVFLCFIPTKSNAEKTIDALISSYVKYYNARDFNSYMSLYFPMSESDIKPLDKILNRVKNSWSKPKEPITNYSFEIRKLSKIEIDDINNWYLLPIAPTHFVSITYDPFKDSAGSGHTLYAIQKGESWYLQIPYIYPSNPNKKHEKPDVTYKPCSFSDICLHSWTFNNLNYKSLNISLWKNNIKYKTLIKSKDILNPNNKWASFTFNKAMLSGQLNNPNPENSYLLLPFTYWQYGKTPKGWSDYVKLEYGVFSNLSVYKTFEINSEGTNTMASFSIIHKDNTNKYEIRAIYIK